MRATKPDEDPHITGDDVVPCIDPNNPIEVPAALVELSPEILWPDM